MDTENKHISNINRFNDIIDTYIVVYNKYVSKKIHSHTTLLLIQFKYSGKPFSIETEIISGSS